MDEIKAGFESRIRNNPSMSSKRYKDALEELKRKVAEKRKK